MKCAKRKRQITETEPVYRLFINVWVHWQMVCGICEAEAASRVFKTNTGGLGFDATEVASLAALLPLLAPGVSASSDPQRVALLRLRR